MEKDRTLLISLCGLFCISLVAAQCDSGGVFFNSKCYYLQNNRLRKTEAQSKCQTDFGGNLATVESLEVQNFLKGELNKRQPSNSWGKVWIGISLKKIYWHWTQDKEILFAQGCFLDDEQRPMLTDFVTRGRNITQSSCVQTCENKGFDYAGIKFDSAALGNVVCRCGNNFPRDTLTVSVNCITPCPDDSKQKCGHFGVQRLFYVKSRNKVDLWVKNQPNNYAGGTQYCGIMDGVISDDPDFLFSDETCDSQFFYICDIPARNSINCTGSGFYYSNSLSRCFFMVQQGSDFRGAVALCHAQSGKLAKVQSQVAYNEVRRFLNDERIGRARVYIGLLNVAWTWNDGEVITYSAWGNRLPAYSGNCVVLNGDEAYLWQDISCQQQYPYICEKVTSATPPPSPATTMRTTTSTVATTTTTIKTTTSLLTKITSASTAPTQPPTTTERIQPTTTARAVTAPPPTTTTSGSGGATSGSATTRAGPPSSSPSIPATSAGPAPTTTSGGGVASSTDSTDRGTTTSSGGGGNTGNQGGTPSTSPSSSSPLSTGVIVAIAVASIAVFVALVRLIVYCAAQRNRSPTSKSGEDNIGYNDAKENGGEHALYSEIDKSSNIKNRESTGSDTSQNNESGPDMLYAY